MSEHPLTPTESDEQLTAEWIEYASEIPDLHVTVSAPFRLTTETLQSIDRMAIKLLELAEDPDNRLSQEEADKQDSDGSTAYWELEDGFEEIND